MKSMSRHFDARQLGDLTLAAIAIKGWNRLSIAFRIVPGTYKPAKARVIEKGP
jgi:alkylhydroperoxidase family enzyme